MNDRGRTLRVPEPGPHAQPAPAPPQDQAPLIYEAERPAARANARRPAEQRRRQEYPRAPPRSPKNAPQSAPTPDVEPERPAPEQRARRSAALYRLSSRIASARCAALSGIAAARESSLPRLATRLLRWHDDAARVSAAVVASCSTWAWYLRYMQERRLPRVAFPPARADARLERDPHGRGPHPEVVEHGRRRGGRLQRGSGGLPVGPQRQAQRLPTRPEAAARAGRGESSPARERRGGSRRIVVAAEGSPPRASLLTRRRPTSKIENVESPGDFDEAGRDKLSSWDKNGQKPKTGSFRAREPIRRYPVCSGLKNSPRDKPFAPELKIRAPRY
jgi:hypothetical protein